MKTDNFADRMIEAILEKKSYLCVGLDPQLRYIPPHLLRWAYNNWGQGKKGEAEAEAFFAFNMAVINATAEFASCFKLQMGFFEEYGSYGVSAFERTRDYVLQLGMIALEDAKREDGSDTAGAYARAHLGEVDYIGPGGVLVKAPSRIQMDSVTITPWIEKPNFTPFIEEAKKNGKGVFVVTKTSFKPASKLQDMETPDGRKAWEVLAEDVREMGKEVIGEHGYSSIGVVMGVTYPAEAEIMKKIIPYAFKLGPGLGLQGAGADDAVIAINDDGFGVIPSNSRGVDYAYLSKFKSKFACDSRYFANAAAREAQAGRDALNAAVLRKIRKLPWG